MKRRTRRPCVRIRPAFIVHERERIARRTRIREIVLGAQDGIVSSVGVLSSVYGAHVMNRTLILVGIASAVAGTISMACGQYLASKAEIDVKRRELALERRKVKEDPDAERAELVAIYRGHGMPAELANQAASATQKHPRRTLAVMAREELGIDLKTRRSAYTDAAIIGISYVCGAAIPLIPYLAIEGFFAFAGSLVLALLCLLGVGVLKASSAEGNPFVSAAECGLIGGAAAGVGYLVGTVVPRALGTGPHAAA